MVFCGWNNDSSAIISILKTVMSDITEAWWFKDMIEWSGKEKSSQNKTSLSICPEDTNIKLGENEKWKKSRFCHRVSQASIILRQWVSVYFCTVCEGVLLIAPVDVVLLLLTAVKIVRQDNGVSQQCSRDRTLPLTHTTLGFLSTISIKIMPQDYSIWIKLLANKTQSRLKQFLNFNQLPGLFTTFSNCYEVTKNCQKRL